MNYEKFEKNIIDMLTEQQIKLGYRKEVIRLYYPVKSVCNLLGICDGSEAERKNEKEPTLRKAILGFKEFSRNHLGDLEFKKLKDGRFCIIVPELGSEFVHNNMPKDCFIKRLIEAINNHCTIDDIFELFKNESGKVNICELKNQDFKYLLYFEDGNPDDYYYCFNVEGHHVIYHRFTKADYLDMYA